MEQVEMVQAETNKRNGIPLGANNVALARRLTCIHTLRGHLSRRICSISGSTSMDAACSQQMLQAHISHLVIYTFYVRALVLEGVIWAYEVVSPQRMSYRRSIYKYIRSCSFFFIITIIITFWHLFIKFMSHTIV